MGLISLECLVSHLSICPRCSVQFNHPYTQIQIAILHPVCYFSSNEIGTELESKRRYESVIFRTLYSYTPETPVKRQIFIGITNIIYQNFLYISLVSAGMNS